ncbi:alkaline phosphatase PhoX [Citricoccus sp. GCM10030269]|uniref:alkaline phosphatase PhoX n=1 Tax=Citricoccus sp. GCM10030269 TaxID=3273388 RepID=UPI003618D753
MSVSQTHQTSTVGRRGFLAIGGTASAAAALSGLMGNTAHAAEGRRRGDDTMQAPDNGGYGPLQPAPGGELLLPAGFTYVAFGHAGTPLSDGTPTPAMHDGMATFEGQNGMINLVRNHENSQGAAFGANPYDPSAAGGTTNLVFDPQAMELVSAYPSLTGTIRNCAGGPTPAGTWLSCEETFTGLDVERPHGYIFEVPADATSPVDPVPLKAMGRFTHEAIAIDPQTGIVYETEDRGTSGLYRFLPNDRDDLTAGGKLQMLAIKARAQYDTRSGQRVGKPLPVEWVDITDPDPDSSDSLAVFNQGFEQGGAVFDRLEGAWYGDGSIYINSTSGGDAGLGQVWEYRPRGNSGGQLVLVYESTDPEVLQSPDNICVSPNTGGLVLCEDGGGKDLLRGVTTDGQIFDLAELASDNTSELAGATFSPDGQILFFNVQTPGITYAITGPWKNGAL